MRTQFVIGVLLICLGICLIANSAYKRANPDACGVGVFVVLAGVMFVYETGKTVSRGLPSHGVIYQEIERVFVPTKEGGKRDVLLLRRWQMRGLPYRNEKGEDVYVIEPMDEPILFYSDADCATGGHPFIMLDNRGTWTKFPKKGRFELHYPQPKPPKKQRRRDENLTIGQALVEIGREGEAAS